MHMKIHTCPPPTRMGAVHLRGAAAQAVTVLQHTCCASTVEGSTISIMAKVYFVLCCAAQGTCCALTVQGSTVSSWAM
eukprot:scaffold97170_cov24-Tisochrysis_lutea.AAC.1